MGGPPCVRTQGTCPPPPPPQERGIDCIEMPLIEHCEGEDLGKLAGQLREGGLDYVCVTSPEAARVFAAEWQRAGSPALRVTVVGKGTARELREHEGEGRLTIAFVPSKASAQPRRPAPGAPAPRPAAAPGVRGACEPTRVRCSQANAETLVAELPPIPGGSGRVLYPASAKAATTLQDGLAARGFQVLRLNTYSTRAVSAVDPATLEAARGADVLTVGSPSAARAWLAVAGAVPDGMRVACIGSTSFAACLKAGLPEGILFAPASPGLDGWADAVVESLGAKPGARA